MTTIIILAIIAGIVYYIYYLSHGNYIESPKTILGGGSDAPVQALQYFNIKDKGYNISIWPKDQNLGDYIEFPIAGLTHAKNIGNYIGEFVGTIEADPTNPYDSNAIKVLAPDGHQVGYVPKDQTHRVRNFTSLPCSCFCFIGINNGTYFSDCYITRK